MCMYNALKRCGAFVAILVICFTLSVPAFAQESNPTVSASFNWSYFGFSGKNGSGTMFYGGSSNVTSVSAPFYGANTPFLTYTMSSGDKAYNPASIGIGFSDFSLVSNDWMSGAVGLYVSMYLDSLSFSSSGYDWFNLPASSLQSLYTAYFEDHLGNEQTSPVTVTTFNPALASSSQGYTFKAQVVTSQDAPISKLGIRSPTVGFSYLNSSNSYELLGLRLYIPSCTVVVTSNSDELAALESMADSIAAQNQIMSQFYGQIVQVCNQIYQRLGDLQSAQEECNRLFSHVIDLLNTTNGKLSAINQAMSTYFELLINQLKQEGIDIRTAISDAEARLEIYLKPMIDYFNELEEQTGESAATLPQHKQDIDGFNNDGFGIEPDGQTGLTVILPIFTAFSFILSVLGIFVGLGVLKIIIKKGLS
jgi:hypothetical protein